MTVHLMATVDNANRILNDIDFEIFLKLSQDQYIIFEDSLKRFVEMNLPDRIFATTTTAGLELAYEHYQHSGRKDVIIIGATAGFIERALQWTDLFHLTKGTAVVKDCTGDFIKPNAKCWNLIHQDPPSDQPKARAKDWLRSRYQRI